MFRSLTSRPARRFHTLLTLAGVVAFVAACGPGRTALQGDQTTEDSDIPVDSPAVKAPELDLQKLVNGAVAHGDSIVSIPPGVHRVTTPTVYIGGASNLTLSGPNSTLLFSTPSKGAFQIVRCHHLTLRGFTVDYDPLPFTQGTITRQIGPLAYEFQIHPGYPSLSKNYQVNHPMIFDADAKDWKRSVPDIYGRVRPLSPRSGVLTVQPNFAGAVSTGDLVALNARSAQAIMIQNCTDTRVEDVTLLSAPGAGVMVRYADGDNYFRYTIRRGPTPPGATQPRLMSTSADGFNYSIARRGPTLERCDFSYEGDDDVNIHGPSFPVVRIENSRTLIVGALDTSASISTIVHPGDSARLLTSGTFSVKQVDPIERWEDVPPDAAPGGVEVHTFFPAIPKNSPLHLRLYRVTFKDPANLREGEFLDVPAISSPNYVIRDCNFHDHRARSIVAKASHGLITGNRFTNIKMAAILVGPEYGLWREAGWVSDVTIENNTLQNCGYSPAMSGRDSRFPGAISVWALVDAENAPPQENSDIVIRNNTIDQTPVSGVYVRGAKNVSVTGNHFSRTNTNRSSEVGANHGIHLHGPITIE